MEIMTAKKICEMVGGKLKGDGDIGITAVVTDTRKAFSGGLFVAIKGENFDGNDYVLDALSKGASGAITNRSDLSVPDGKFIISVKNTKDALLELARKYKSELTLKTVAVTGSVGKTTTKEMIYEVIAREYKTHKTEGNLNNEIGLPLSILKLETSHEAAVFELGMSGFGEIEILSRAALPDVAVITNIGSAHIEKLGSKEGILKAKLEIMHGLKKDGILILNGDDPLLYSLKNVLPVKTWYYGMEEYCDFRAVTVKESEGGIKFNVTGLLEGEFLISQTGKHQIYNALSAIAAGLAFCVPTEKIKEGLLRYRSGAGRQHIFKEDGITIIDDTYNANPDSMNAALDILSIGEGRKFAVLGDMLELGETSKVSHEELGRRIYEAGADGLFGLGELMRYTCDAASKAGLKQVFHGKAQDEIIAELKKVLKPGDLVLFKGSRGMKMENILYGVFKGE